MIPSELLNYLKQDYPAISEATAIDEIKDFRSQLTFDGKHKIRLPVPLPHSFLDKLDDYDDKTVDELLPMMNDYSYQESIVVPVQYALNHPREYFLVAYHPQFDLLCWGHS